MLWAESSLLPAELRVTFACINEKDLSEKGEIWFAELRSTNEKDLQTEGLFSRDRRGLNSQPPA